MAAYTAVTLLSSAGTSPPLSLDPTAKTTTISLQATGLSSGDVTIQANLFFPPGQLGGTGQAQSWVALSSHFSSSSFTADGAFLSVLVPIAGLRLSSTSWSAGTATLQALQAIQS